MKQICGLSIATWKSKRKLIRKRARNYILTEIPLSVDLDKLNCSKRCIKNLR